MKDAWKEIALTPLTGMLDTRSRPAELAPGAFRYKLNMSVNRTGALSTRSGHAALNFGLRSDNPEATPNWDFHYRNAVTRNPITFLFESTSPTGVRTLFSGTDTELSRLDNDTSEWTNLSPGGTGKRWRAAALNDKIIFTNTGATGAVSGVLSHTLGQPGFTGVAQGDAGYIMSAKVAITFADVVLLMNLVEDPLPAGGAFTTTTSRVRWSDYQLGDKFTESGASVAGFQDLDYGDAILNAVEMMGALYIFCERSIWRCVTNITENTVFAFQKIYSEPKNQNGCLAYANSLVTTGRELVWLGRDSIWTFNPYIIAPESPDWMLKASGSLFSSTHVDRMEKRCCDSIIGEYRPLTKEVWFSYPTGNDYTEGVCINNRCLVLNMEHHTADSVDTGYSALANFKRTATSDEACNADQVFIGASTGDYCLKSIGGVFHRETVNLIGNDVTNDIPSAAYSTTEAGYFSRLVGLCPFGFPNEEKTLNSVTLDNDTPANDLASPNLITLRIGNSYTLQDPMSEDANCAVQWHEQDSIPLTCPDETSIAAMTAAGQRPSDDTGWDVFEKGNRLYYDFKITSATGAAPTDHDSAWSAIRFNVMVE